MGVKIVDVRCCIDHRLQLRCAARGSHDDLLSRGQCGCMCGRRGRFSVYEVTREVKMQNTAKRPEAANQAAGGVLVSTRTLTQVQRLFPQHFQNYGVGE
jgi:hypothetical protein